MTPLTVGHEPSRRTERRNLVRHFVEMVLAMLAGMAVLGMVAGLICAALGHSGFLSEHAGLRAWVMALNVTIGMAVWMRYRGHGWGAITEKGGAMFVPVAVLSVPYWAGAISAAALLVGMHVLMLPAMVVAMLHRRDEYVQDHRRHRAANRTQSAV